MPDEDARGWRGEFQLSASFHSSGCRVYTKVAAQLLQGDRDGTVLASGPHTLPHSRACRSRGCVGTDLYSMSPLATRLCRLSYHSERRMGIRPLKRGDEKGSR